MGQRREKAKEAGKGDCLRVGASGSSPLGNSRDYIGPAGEQPPHGEGRVQSFTPSLPGDFSEEAPIPTKNFLQSVRALWTPGAPKGLLDWKRSRVSHSDLPSPVFSWLSEKTPCVFQRA